MLARGGLGIAALEAVEADHLKRLVLLVGRDGERGGDALALDLDRITLGDAERLECGARHSRYPAAAFLLARGCDLQPDRAFLHLVRIRIRHRSPALHVFVREAELGSAPPEIKPCRRRMVPGGGRLFAPDTCGRNKSGPGHKDRAR